VLARAFDARGEPQYLRLRVLPRRDHGDHFRLAFGLRASLVHHKGIDPVHPF